MPSWNWGEQSSESQVVHESVSGTDHNSSSVLKQGYAIANPYKSSNLVLYWPFHENSGDANDFSGNGYTGSVSGVNQGVTGILGTSAYDFDGSDDYVYADTTIIGQGNSFSHCFWVRIDDTSSEDQYFGNESDGSSDGWEFVYNHNGNQKLELGWPGTGSHQAPSNTSITSTGWYYIGCQTDYSSSLAYYIDGTWETHSISNISDPNRNFRFGEQSTGGNNFDGAAVDVRLYNTRIGQSAFEYLHNVTITQGSWTSTKKTL